MNATLKTQKRIRSIWKFTRTLSTSLNMPEERAPMKGLLHHTSPVLMAPQSCVTEWLWAWRRVLKYGPQPPALLWLLPFFENPGSHGVEWGWSPFPLSVMHDLPGGSHHCCSIQLAQGQLPSHTLKDAFLAVSDKKTSQVRPEGTPGLVIRDRGQLGKGTSSAKIIIAAISWASPGNKTMSYLIHSITLWGRHYYPHFIGKETEASK